MSALLVLSLFLFAVANESPKNVLFIVVDDLRPQLSFAYRQTVTLTPNLDQLAKEGLVFSRAYCQQAVCAPSRNSFMTGRRPDTVKAWNFLNHFREPGIGDKWISLPEYFKLHNYTTLGGGKTFHPGLPPFYDEPRSWSQQMGYYLFIPEVCPGEESYCGSDEALTDFYDYRLAQNSIDALQLAKNLSAPFFIATGFRRPHKPWRIPQKIFSMYPNWTDIEVAKSSNHSLGMPPIAFNEGNFKVSGTKYKSDFNIPLPQDVQQKVRLAYYASVTWVDSMVGAVLNELDELGLRNNTVVVLFGDHGYVLVY